MLALMRRAADILVKVVSAVAVVAALAVIAVAVPVMIFGPPALQFLSMGAALTGKAVIATGNGISAAASGAMHNLGSAFQYACPSPA